MNFDAIILDIDGTIWNTTELVAQAWNKAIDMLFPSIAHVSADVLKTQFGKTMEQIANNLFPSLNQNEKQKLIDTCCIEEHKVIVSNTKDITYPTVRDTIPLLAKKYKLFIVSNCQKGYIELTMQKNALEPYILDTECYGNTGEDKDKNIITLCKRNALKNPVYVGDTQGDMLSCQKANVTFIWASYGFGQAENYYKKIEKFSDLLEVLG